MASAVLPPPPGGAAGAAVRAPTSTVAQAFTAEEANTASASHHAAIPPALRRTAAAPGAVVAAPASSVVTAVSSAASRSKFVEAREANAVRIFRVTQRLAVHFKGVFRLYPDDLFNLCFTLARGIDYAITWNDVPVIAHALPPLMMQVYQLRNEAFLQSAIMVLMISIKNACRKGWFQVAESSELLNMANELSSNFCIGSVNSEESNAPSVISRIIRRFYPQMNLGRLLVYFEAKPGYEILVADFDIPMIVTAPERIGLFVAQTDNIETSSCIISPPHVNFLVNGKGVEKRTNVSSDNGPQFPTDITKMLKYGINLIQAVGHFSGNYIIAVAFMSTINFSFAPILDDYVQPVVAALAPDSEIIEGPSRISLNCPISFTPIKTPVKGHLCKHHQCFDYDNFMAMNSIKPSWRCPHCNQPVSFVDIRIDQNMLKILAEAGKDVPTVIISVDGSWKGVVECNGNADKLHSRTFTGQQGETVACEPDRPSSALSDVVDLTMEEDGQVDASTNSRGAESLVGFLDHSETEDWKPFQDIFHDFAVSGFVSAPAPVNCTSLITQAAPDQEDYIFRSSILSSTPASDGETLGASESSVYNVLLDPIVTDAISPTFNREGVAVTQPTFTLQNVQQVTQFRENLHLQQPQNGNTISINDGGRQQIPRNASRNSISVQALPAQFPDYNQRPRTITCSSSSIPYISHQTPPSQGVTSDGTNVLNTGIARQQVTRISDLISSSVQLQFTVQNRDRQSHQQIPNPAFQHAVGLSAPNLVSERAKAGSYSTTQPQLAAQNPHPQYLDLRAWQTTQPHPAAQNPHPQYPDFRARQTVCQTVNTAPQSYRFSSVPAQHVPQNAVGTAAGMNQSQLMAAAQLARLQQASQLASRTVASPAMTSDNLGHAEQQLQSLGGEVPATLRSNGFSDLLLEQNWQPTGRMRGSLMGSDYYAAISHYMVPPSQLLSSRPPASSPAPAVAPNHLPLLL